MRGLAVIFLALLPNTMVVAAQILELCAVRSLRLRTTAIAFISQPILLGDSS